MRGHLCRAELDVLKQAVCCLSQVEGLREVRLRGSVLRPASLHTLHGANPYLAVWHDSVPSPVVVGGQED